MSNKSGCFSRLPRAPCPFTRGVGLWRLTASAKMDDLFPAVLCNLAR